MSQQKQTVREQLSGMKKRQITVMDLLDYIEYVEAKGSSASFTGLYNFMMERL